MEWSQVLKDSSLQNLPYKIELNQFGKIEMSPASNRHGYLQSRMGIVFEQQLPNGIAITECSILTPMGVRVPDVAWASEAFLKKYGFETPYPAAPEICVEILSDSNSDKEMAEKIKHYCALGAQEVWLVYETGQIRYFGSEGERKNSQFNIKATFPKLERG